MQSKTTYDMFPEIFALLLPYLPSFQLGFFSFGEFFSLTGPIADFAVGMVIYTIFVFKYYRFLARRDIFQFNLTQYNSSTHPQLQKIFHGFLYLVEHIILFPFFMLFWFGILTILLVFLSQATTVDDVLSFLPVSIAFVITVRVTSYYRQDLSKDLAKLLPFALLGIFLVNISYFNFNQSLSLIESIPTIPNFLPIMVYYIVLATLIEFVLRIGSLIYGHWKHVSGQRPKKELST